MQTHDNWRVQQALKSTRSLSDIIGELTEADCLRALELEVASKRRRATVDRLINKIADMHRQETLAKLKEQFKWHATKA